MAKGIYVGIPTQLPIKNTSTTNYTLSLANIDKFFTVQTGTTSSTQWTRSDVSGGGLKLVPGNIGVNSSTATITLTANRNLTGVVISGAYYTESNYDKITLTVYGTTVLSAVSGTSAAAQRWSGSLPPGASVVLTYTKDSSQHASSESNTYFQVVCDSLQETTEVITGYEIRSLARNVAKMYVGVDNVARKIKKMYIGVDGVAKSVFGQDDVPKSIQFLVEGTYYEADAGMTWREFIFSGYEGSSHFMCADDRPYYVYYALLGSDAQLYNGDNAVISSQSIIADGIYHI